jgi:hypothetical protein
MFTTENLSAYETVDRRVHLVVIFTLTLKRAARLISARRINRRSPLLNVPDNSFLVDDERRAAADKPFLIEDAVGFDRLSLDVAEQREGHSYIFLETFVSGVAVNTDADDLRISFLEVGDISLIRLQLLRSTAGKSQHVEGERDVLLSPKVAELDGLPVGIGEGEIGSHVPNFELRLRSAWLLRGRATDTIARA